MSTSSQQPFEWVHAPRKYGDFIRCQIAVGGQLAPSMDIPVPTWHGFPTEAALFAYLLRQARGLISQFGDARGGERTAA